MQLGDLIVAIDRSSTAMMSLGDLAVLLQGPPGSLINFDIDREGNKHSLQLQLKDVFP
jgi:C-terminal processing protease CtpA/Prc